MSTFVIFATVFVCGFVTAMLRNVMLDAVSDHGRPTFIRNERIYWAVLALALVAHWVVFNALMVTTSVTQWGADLTISGLVVLATFVRFMDVYRAAKNRRAEGVLQEDCRNPIGTNHA
jgi:hypothetical protein